MNEYYAHTIKISNFDVKDFVNLEEIFQTGYLLSRRRQRKSGNKSIKNSILTALFNGMDYISLCDLKMNHDNPSSYNMYTKKGLSLLFDRSIPVIIPTVVSEYDYNYFNMQTSCGKDRYTDLIDEVQVKDKIALSHLKGLCLPLSVISSFHDMDYITDYIKCLNVLLAKYHYDVPIYNLDDGEIIKKLVK